MDPTIDQDEPAKPVFAATKPGKLRCTQFTVLGGATTAPEHVAFVASSSSQNVVFCTGEDFVRAATTGDDGGEPNSVCPPLSHGTTVDFLGAPAADVLVVAGDSDVRIVGLGGNGLPSGAGLTVPLSGGVRASALCGGRVCLLSGSGELVGVDSSGGKVGILGAGARRVFCFIQRVG